MSRPPAIDANVTLRELLCAEDLEEVVASYAEMHSCGVGIGDSDGSVLAVSSHLSGGTFPDQPVVETAEGGRLYRAPLTSGDEVLGFVVVEIVADDQPRAQRVARHIAEVMSVLAHSAHARYLTSLVHVTAMDDAFQEMEDKNRRLLQAVDRMQELDRVKTSFLATVSHELRTPLTSVIGYSEMLLEGLAGELNAEQRDYVQTILAKADQLLQLITGILDVSLIDSGTLKLAREPVVVREVVQSVVSAFEPEATRRGIAIETPNAVLPRVLGDARKIRQVLWNLVANALKFSHEGSRVYVEQRIGPLSPGDAAGKFGTPVDVAGDPDHFGLQVVVRDDGIGISPEKHLHIFEPFFQVDSSSTREYGGTGLGLTLAKSYVDAHGGHIWVDSQLGGGSAFTVSLPVVPRELEQYLRARSARGGQ